MNNDNHDEVLGKEKIGKLFLKLSIPAVIAQLINVLYNIIDRMYIGHIETIGGDALTGVGVTFPIITFVSAFASLCSMGGAPKAAICLGKREKEQANGILGNCFTMTLVLAAILTAAVLIFGEKLLLAFGASQNTIGYAKEYIDIYAIGTVFVMISLGLNMFITTQGFSGISMMTVIIGAALNIGLDPLFIFAFGLGVKGAAIATVISQAVSAAFVLCFLFSQKSVLKITLKSMIPQAKTIFSCVALGIAPFIMQSTESILSVCFNTSLQNYRGDTAVGAMTILSSLMQFAMLPLQGFTQGAQPIISYNYGAKNAERCKKAFKLLLTTCLIYSLLFWMATMSFPEVFAKLFTGETEIILYTASALRIYMAAVGIFGIQIACQQTFIALDKAGISVFLAVLRKIILLIPLIYIIPLFTADKSFGVFLAEPVADTIAVLTTAISFFFIFRKTMKSIDRSPENANITA